MRTNVNRFLCAGAAIAIGLATAPALQAQRELFRWSGRVDQEVQLTVSGRNVTASNIGPNEPGQLGLTMMSALPRREGQVTVQVLEGRGSVDVVRQPSAANGYVAAIRIRDPQGGSGRYQIEADWQPAAAGELAPSFGRGIGSRYENRLALQWSGDVDDDLQIRLGPNGVSYRTLHGRDPESIESAFRGIPSGVTHVDILQREGRDPVVVTQQPSPNNGYTAIIRVRDLESGFGHYAFDILWR